MRNKKYKKANAVERLGILGYAHNQGAGGAAKWLRTGIVKKDGFGTRGTKYYYAVKRALRGLSENIYDQMLSIINEVQDNELDKNKIQQENS